MSWNPSRRKISAAQRQRILKRDRYTCAACGGRRCGNSPLEVDHLIPQAEGGSDADENLQSLGAHPCHSDKTREEQRRGVARKSTKRPEPPHPGLIG